MIESPIRRKHVNYPKDFIPSNPPPATHNKKFAFSEGYQIDPHVIKKYERSIEQDKNQQEKGQPNVAFALNPEKIGNAAHELLEEAPLGLRQFGKKHEIDADLLKKPRFSVKNNEEIAQSNEAALEESTSPGGIRKQLLDRQAPLPLEDPCRIDLLQPANKISKIPQSYIKYRSAGNFDGKAWRQSQKQIVLKFQESRVKRSMNQLPVVNKHPLNQSFNAASAKDIYDSFRKRQQSTAVGFGNINSFLISLKREERRGMEASLGPALPRFQPSAIQKLKEDINLITKRRRGQGKEEHVDNNNYPSSDSEAEEKKVVKTKKHAKTAKSNNHRLPEYLVSYRSSLSYLKDLFAQTSTQEQFKLTVKIPKLFTENLIFKNQQKSQLYDTARSIFTQLRIPCQNLVIKRYTNCTMVIARNICLIWHFDGKRYLGGWQTEFLDEGVKHGLGLEWQPKSYVYYGEFAKNRREGLGAFKDRNNAVYVGYWRKGKRCDEVMAEQEQQIEEQLQQQEEEEEDPYENEDAYYQYL